MSTHNLLTLPTDTLNGIFYYLEETPAQTALSEVSLELNDYTSRFWYPPALALQIYGGTQMCNREICRLYTHEYNTFLYTMLINCGCDNMPHAVMLEQRNSTAILEQTLAVEMSKKDGSAYANAVCLQLYDGISDGDLPACLIALDMGAAPPKNAQENFNAALLSLSRKKMEGRERFLEALLEKGIEIPNDWGQYALKMLKEDSNFLLDFAFLKMIITCTQEKFVLGDLRAFLARDYYKSEELVYAVELLLQNLTEYPPALQVSEFQKNMLKNEIVVNCLRFENANALLALMQESNIKGNCSTNLELILKAAEAGIKIEPSVAQFFIGNTAQFELNMLIKNCKEDGMPSQAVLDVLTACGGSVDEMFLIDLLPRESDEAIALTLQLMKGVPSERALRNAIQEKRFEALQMMMNLGAVPTENLLYNRLFHSTSGETPNLELITLLVKGGAPISRDIMATARSLDNKHGWDLEKTLLEASGQ